jgi:hypothetical protein
VAVLASVLWNEWRPVRLIDVHEAEADHQKHDRHLDDDDEVVEAGGLLDADDEECRHEADEKHCRQVDDRAGLSEPFGLGQDACSIEFRGLGILEWRVGQRRGHVDPECLSHEGREIPRPTHGDGRCAEQILEDQIPADDPGDELAEGRIAIGVRASRDGNHARELGVAQTGEQTAQSRENEGQNDGGSRVLRGGGAGQHEDSGADDGADAQRGEIQRAEGAL